MKKKNKKVVKKRGMSAGNKAALGAGMVAASAGAYYFLGPKGRKHQQKAKVFMNKMEREIKEKAKKAKDVSEPIYHEMVDALARKYSEEYEMHEPEIKALARKLKSNWKKVKKVSRPVVKKAKRQVKKAVRKAVKRASRR